ncbi:hypothetical protein [Acinetobacter sp. NIPH 2699]|uniref:hypothetical protein n=1 Tax=Acinetobacter sp. NIPH 2699 TaxID=2923433 RepID=UPI001F4B9DB8|nr:hypothetical protein [Acinetobacter sp. NIPH 2699]MCH7335672.1 hypothetical protein [Acinetobacter sp. NIPH 2699]
MKKTIKFSDNDIIEFDFNRAGFIQAVSYKESSSDLRQPLNARRNVFSAAKKNDKGYIGLFQFGEAALIDLGYYKHWDNNTDKTKANDWTGAWTGKAGVNNLSQFLNSPDKQLQAIHEWIDLLCNRLRNRNFNEFYGKTINGVEITESGAIAGAHLVGDGGLGSFFGVNGFKGKYKESDGNGVHISKYIEMFNHFDLENCCKRKIYISLTDSEKNALANKEVVLVSRYDGKYVSGETRVRVKSDEQGNLPVTVRHPNTEIKIVADGKTSNSIIQKANEKQKATLSDFSISSYPATLEAESTPQPKPQTNKTPQEVRNEQVPPSSAVDSTPVLKDIHFNVQIVEGDSGKPIPNMNFFLTYKGNIKKHTADNNGIRKGVVAEEGQDIEVSVDGDGQKQVIHHFKVSSALNNQTVKVKLPVHSFNITVTQEGKNVANTLFSIFYRGREIPKRTNASGVINVRMLTGFVFGFGIKGKSLILSRVEKTVAMKGFTVNASAVKASKLYETADEQRKKEQQAESARLQQQQKEAQAKSEQKAKEEAEKAKTEADRKKQAKQDNSYTQNGGKPLTTVGNQAPVTSDTTRYHIYHNGKIRRENKAATGFAEFIYYDQKGGAHNLGKSEFIKAPMRKSGNSIIAGNCYLIDFTKHGYYKKDGIGYKWYVSSDVRYYLNGVTLAAILGTFMSLGYQEYPSTGGSLRDGSSKLPSKTHRNGEACDFRYLAKNNAHRNGAIWTTYSSFDMQANTMLTERFRIFGFRTFYTQDSMDNKRKVAMIAGTSFAPNHYHHLHIGEHNYLVEDI